MEIIKKWLLDWFKKNALIDEKIVEASLNEDYFEKGWLDSFKFITFILDIEQEFGIRFANDEFQNKEFSTIAGLCNIIASRKNEKK